MFVNRSASSIPCSTLTSEARPKVDQPVRKAKRGTYELCLKFVYGVMSTFFVY